MTKPLRRAWAISATAVLSVRYRVSRGAKRDPGGNAAAIRSRYAAAAATVVTGGSRLGMTTARPNTRAVAPTTERIGSPSRKWRCQSSGRVIVSVVTVIWSPRYRCDYTGWHALPGWGYNPPFHTATWRAGR